MFLCDNKTEMRCLHNLHNLLKTSYNLLKTRYTEEIVRGIDVAGVKGKTGNPGIKNPKKKGSASFQALSAEPRGRQMGFRPVESLGQKIEDTLAASGLKTAELLELAVIAYLEERKPEEMMKELEQLFQQRGIEIDPSRPLPKNVRRFPPAIAGDKSPAAAGQQLEQGQLSSGDSSRTEEPATTTSNQAPASRSRNTSRKKDQASNAKTSSISKRSPRTGARTRKATTG